MERVPRDGMLIVVLLAAVGCAHAASPEGGGAVGPNGPPIETQPGTTGGGDAGDAVLPVVWTDPSSRFALACGADLFDQRQHWLRSDARGPLTERFVIRAGSGKLQFFVADTARFQSVWGIFEDDYVCAGGGSLRVDVHVEALPDGRLAFETRHTAQGCQVAGASRRFVTRQSELPRRICCGEHRDEFRAE